MVNLLKANANVLDEFIKENLSKDVTFKFEKDEMLIVVENVNEKGLKLIVKMHKNALDQKQYETINWHYLADPKDPKSNVNRKCKILDLGTTFKEIVENKRFDKNYLNELENPAQ